MKSLALLALTLIACTRTADTGDDDPTPDGAVEEDPECKPTFPRTVEPEAFTAPSGLQTRITTFIDGAQDSLDIQMYLFTVSAIRQRVIAAHDRGVAVRVLLDPDHEGNITTRNMFQSTGVPTRNAPGLYSFSHAKYMIADRAKALVMSANFNVDAMDEERNYGFIDRDPRDLADLQAIFDMDWGVSGGEQVQAADLSCTRLVVSPNNTKARIVALIDSATSTLEIEAMYISETSVRDAIVAAKERGVAVRVILDGSSDESGAISFFRGKGIEVHTSTGFFLHAKLIVADGVAYVGSTNYSITALTRNREVGALIFEPAQAQIIKSQFDADWSTSSVVP